MDKLSTLVKAVNDSRVKTREAVERCDARLVCESILREREARDQLILTLLDVISEARRVE
jgi:hypothetical protein